MNGHESLVCGPSREKGVAASSASQPKQLFAKPVHVFSAVHSDVSFSCLEIISNIGLLTESAVRVA